MIFWIGLVVVVVTEFGYDALGDYGYFAFATATQIQLAALALMVFGAQTYRDTAAKAVSLLVFLWFAWVALTDWAAWASPLVGAVEAAVFIAWCCYAYRRIRAVQG